MNGGLQRVRKDGEKFLRFMKKRTDKINRRVAWSFGKPV